MAWKQENELFDVVAKRKQKIENRREKMLVMYLCCCSDGKSDHVQFIIIVCQFRERKISTLKRKTSTETTFLSIDELLLSRGGN